MKFKMSSVYYAICWFVLYVMFNIVTFAVPATYMKNDEMVTRYTSPLFWIAYALITVSFFLQLIVAVLVLLIGKREKKSFNLPVFVTSGVGFAIMIIVGSVCMALNHQIAQWIGIVVCFVVFGFTIIASVMAKSIGHSAQSFEKRISGQTKFIKNLSADASTLSAKTQDDEIKSLCKKVADAIRFSDPMSNKELDDVEGKISDKYDEFKDAVEENNKETASAATNLLIALIEERNAKCKLLK